MMKKSFACGAALVLALTAVVGCGSSGSDTKAKAASESGSADFGAMKNVCHKATGKNKANSDRGVTASSIRITTISDAGSSLQPGLNQELWDAATVFTRWCNDQGGINGRRILMTKGDAQVLKYTDAIDAACKSSFALVGGGGAFDNTGQDARVKCKLPALPGFVASAEARSAPLSFPAVSSPVGSLPVGDMMYIRDRYGSNQPVATIYGNFDTTKFTGDQEISAAKGISPPLASSESPVNAAELQAYPPTGQEDWRPTADSITKSKAQGVLFTGQPPDLGALMTALAADNNKSVKWVNSFSNMYDQVLISDARAALSTIPLYVELFTYPFEEAGQGKRSQAIDEFLDLFKRYLPDGKSHAMLAVSGFASWLLFAQAASSCGADLTRSCLIKGLKTIHDFDAGGLIAPRNPSDPKQASQCFALMKATPSGFVRVQDKYLQPSEDHWPFTCGKKYVFTFNPAAAPMKAWIDKDKWTDAERAKLERALP